MGLNVGSLVATLDIDKKPFERGFAAWRTQVKAGARGATDDIERETGRQRDALGRFAKQSSEEGEKSGRGWGRGFLKGMSGGDSSAISGLASKLIGSLSSTFSLSAKTLATGFSAQFTGAVAAGLASGAAKVAHGAAAMLALLPAAVGAGVLAIGTLKLAVAGVGDALSAGLSGDTEKFNEALKGLSPSARSFARDVAGMRGQIDGLKSSVQEAFFERFGGQVKQLGSNYLPMVQRAMTAVAGSFGQAVHEAGGFLNTPSTVRAVRSALGDMSGAIDNVTAALPNLVRAFLPLVTVGATFLPQLTAGFGGASSSLADFMEHARDTGKLADFIQGGIDKLQSLWHTGQRVWGIIKNVVAVFQDFGGFGGIFSSLGLKSGGLLTSLEELTTKARAFFETSAGGKAMAEIITTIRNLMNAGTGMFAKLAGVLAPFFPQIAEFATAVENLMTGIVDAAQPAIEMFLRDLLPAITDVVNFLTEHTPILQGLLIGLFTAWAAGAIAAAIPTLAAALPFIAIGVAVAALAALIIANWDTIKNATAAVFGFIADHWQLLLTILTGGIAGAAIFIVDHWDTIKGAAAAVWRWITDHWQLLFSILAGPFGLAAAFVIDHLASIVHFVRDIPGKITRAASGMWDGLKSGLVSVVNWIIRQLNRIHFSIPDWVPGVGGNSFGIDLPEVSAGGGGGGGKPAPAHASSGGGGGLIMHDGGVVPGPRGQEIAAVLQGGERVLALNDPINSMLSRASADLARSGAGLAVGGPSGAGGSPIRVVLEVQPKPGSNGRLADALVESLQYEVRTRGGGDVAVALGSGSVGRAQRIG